MLSAASPASAAPAPRRPAFSFRCFAGPLFFGGAASAAFRSSALLRSSAPALRSEAFGSVPPAKVFVIGAFAA